jgi:hypothetical protein
MRKGSVATVRLGLRDEKFVESSTSLSLLFLLIISLGLLHLSVLDELSPLTLSASMIVVLNIDLLFDVI